MQERRRSAAKAVRATGGEVLMPLTMAGKPLGAAVHSCKMNRAGFSPATGHVRRRGR